jgi:hypothetical protein
MVHDQPFRHPPVYTVASGDVYVDQSLLLLCNGRSHHQRAAMHAISTSERDAVERTDSAVPSQGLEPEFWQREGVMEQGAVSL